MSKVNTRAPFFPRSRNIKSRGLKNLMALKRNDSGRSKELMDKTSKDVKVDIHDKVKDFSRIKRAVDLSSPLGEKSRLEQLKSKIQNGEYNIDYDSIANNILQQEF